MAIEFGYGLITCERHPAQPDRTAGELYREALDLAQRAEMVGLDSVWTTEHHFVDSDYLPVPMTMAAAMAAVTNRISVGTGVALAPLHHPVRLAEEAATIDLLADGRFILGLGLGWSKVEFAAFGADIHRRGRALDEILDILAQAERDDLVRHHGEIYDLPEVSIRPKPARGHVTTWLGGTAAPAVRRAVRGADGVFVHTPLEEFRAQMQVVREELDRTGRDPSTFTIALYLTILPDVGGRDGWDRYGELVIHTQWKYRDMGRSASRIGQAPPVHGELDAETLGWLRGCTLTGSPERIAEQVAAFREAAHGAGGSVHLMARNYLPGLSGSEQVELLERWATQVVPLLR